MKRFRISVMTYGYEKTLTLREVYDYIHLLGIRIKSDFSCLSKLITEISHGQFSNLSDFESQASKLLSDLENLKTASFKLETKEVLELSRFISLINNPTLSSIINNSKEIKSIFEDIIDSVNDKFRIQLKNQKRGKLGKTPKHTAIKRLFTSNKRLSRSTKHSSKDLKATNSDSETQKSQIENLVLKLSQNNLNISEQDKSNLSDLITQYLSDLKEKIDSTFSLEENCNLQESNLFSELSKLQSIKNPQLQTILTNFFTKYQIMLKKDIRAAKHLKNEDTSILKNAQNTLHCIFKPNKDKTSKQKMPIEDKLNPEDSSPQMTRRNFLGLAVKTGAVVGGTAAGLGIASKALAGGPSPDEFTITDENHFLEIISRYNRAWVMYTFTGSKMDSTHQKRGDNFWDILKIEFDRQVDAYIIVDCTTWSNYAKKAEDEIGKNKFPSFILYHKGKIVRKSNNEIILHGGPKKEIIKPALNYIKENSFLY